MNYPPTIMPDTGCETAHEAAGRKVQCVECPFETCVLDVPAPTQRAQERQQRATVLMAQGMTPREAAKVMDMSKRQVERYRLTAQG